jgi:hypothetical protein
MTLLMKKCNERMPSARSNAGADFDDAGRTTWLVLDLDVFRGISLE